MELKPGVNTFGRGYANDFRVDDPSVSASHAEIIVNADSVVVKDLGSTNGTFINRSQIREGFLQTGQTLCFGAVEMLYESQSATETPTNAVARTIALPQVGGIKIARPGPVVGGSVRPANYPVPMAPTPVLNTAPVGIPATAASAPVVPRPASVTAPLPTVAVSAEQFEPQGVKPLRTAPADAGVLLRCVGFGFGAAVLAGAGWVAFAALARATPAPYSFLITGVLCGLALKIAARKRSGAAISLLAAGYALLGMFIGACGQVFTIQTVDFAGFNLIGLIGGVVCALVIGGVGFGQGGRRAEFAG